MFENYVLLDVENPNTRGNSICAIAVVLVENDEVVEKKYSLINPEDRFDPINSKINGIDADQVQDSPTLKEYWPEVGELLKNHIIIGHNVSYDLAVLSRALQRYDIEVENYRYSCTLELSRNFMKADSYKLENLAKNIGYEYYFQIALDDALAAGELFSYLKERYPITVEEIHKYSLEQRMLEKIDERLISNLHNLSGIIQGILFSNHVNDVEMARLKKWVDDNQIYKHYTLFAKIIDTLTVILEDKKVDQYDRLKLKCLVTKYESSRLYSETTLGIQILQGIIEGIVCDDTIEEKKIIKLKVWLEEHDYLTGVYPYDKLMQTVTDVINDGVIDEQEKQMLLENFKEIADPMSAHSYMGNDISLRNKTFCLTGEFMSAPRTVISKKLKEKGAIEKGGVTSKLDYLFVGGMGSNSWKFGLIGGKIAKALELQEKGGMVKIVSEADMERVLL